MIGNLLFKNEKAARAADIGLLCSAAYLAVYFARNILGAVTPQMIERGYSAEFIGRVSSLYFICYAVGQLVNGAIGDRVRARYMICIGLLMASISNRLFYYVIDTLPFAALLAYGLMGFFLSMIYGPMTKVVAENTEPVYTMRCTLGYTFASLFGSPLAGFAAALLTWRSVLLTGSLSLAVMSVCCFVIFRSMEKRGIIKYNQYRREKENGKGDGIRLLFRRGIVKYTLISMITGVVRTTVIFWMPTYIAQHLGFPAETASFIFTTATLAISMEAFIAVFIYERLMKRNMERTILFMFLSAALFFFLLTVFRQPAWNVVCLVLGIMSSNGASVMLYSRYCPGLRDTGMVSGATGFLDFSSYAAASVSSTLFAGAVGTVGWEGLVWTWFGLMAAGVVISLPYGKWSKRI